MNGVIETYTLLANEVKRLFRCCRLLPYRLCFRIFCILCVKNTIILLLSKFGLQFANGYTVGAVKWYGRYPEARRPTHATHGLHVDPISVSTQPFFNLYPSPHISPFPQHPQYRDVLGKCTGFQPHEVVLSDHVGQ